MAGYYTPGVGVNKPYSGNMLGVRLNDQSDGYKVYRGSGMHVPSSWYDTGSEEEWSNMTPLQRMRIKKDAERGKLGFHDDNPMSPRQIAAMGRVVSDKYESYDQADEPGTMGFAIPTEGSLHLPSEFDWGTVTHESGHLMDKLFADQSYGTTSGIVPWNVRQHNKFANFGDANRDSSEGYDRSFSPLDISSGRSVVDMQAEGGQPNTVGNFGGSKNFFGNGIDHSDSRVDYGNIGNEYIKDSYGTTGAHGNEGIANTIWWRGKDPQDLQMKNPVANDYLNEQIRSVPGLWDILSKKKPNIWGTPPSMA